MPLVSVCIPVYNGSSYLEECIRSITDQRGVDMEIIVTDDHSTDGSLEIAKSMQSFAPAAKWKFIRHSENLGMAANWNYCLRMAEGDYVKIMGQDDILYPGALASQSGMLIKHQNVSIVVSGCDIMRANGKKLFKRPRKRKSGIYLGDEMIKDCLRKRANLIGEPVTVMARRSDFEKLGGFSSDQRYYIDLDMWLRLLGIGDCCVIENSQCSFRVHGKAVSVFSQNADFNNFDNLPGAQDYLKKISPFSKYIRETKAQIMKSIRYWTYLAIG